MMESKKDKILKFGGYSSSMGVTYYSDNYIVGCYYDLSNNVRTIIKKRNKNYIKVIKDLLPDLYEEKEKHYKKQHVFEILEALLLMVCEIFLQNLLLKLHLFKIFFVLVQIFIVGFIVLSIFVFCVQDKRVCYFHGAEHKVRRAFDKFGFVPNIAEIKKCSRYHSRCGVSLPTNVLFLLNIFYIIAIKFNIIMPPLSLLVSAGLILPSINPYSLILQFFVTTKEPTNKEIVIAKTAYERLLELENGYENILDNEEISSIRRENFYTLFDEDVCFSSDYDFVCLTTDENIKMAVKREWSDILYQQSIENILFEGVR